MDICRLIVLLRKLGLDWMTHSEAWPLKGDEEIWDHHTTTETMTPHFWQVEEGWELMHFGLNYTVKEDDEHDLVLEVEVVSCNGEGTWVTESVQQVRRVAQVRHLQEVYENPDKNGEREYWEWVKKNGTDPLNVICFGDVNPSAYADFMLALMDDNQIGV